MEPLNFYHIIIGLILLFIGVYVDNIDDTIYTKQFYGGTKKTNSTDKIALCFRTYNPTNLILDQIFKIFKSVNSRTDIVLWISIDTTLYGNAPFNFINDYCKKNKLSDIKFHIHKYSVDDVVKAYPALDKKHKDKYFIYRLIYKDGNAIKINVFDVLDKKNKEHKTNKYTINWGFHIEPILLWYKEASKFNNISNVWVMEDDIGVCGNINIFLDNYKNEPADFIAHNIHREVTWYWFFEKTKKLFDLILKKKSEIDPFFMEHYIGYSSCICNEHIIRLSSKFLNELHKYSTNAVIGWSELALPTLCAASKCIMKPIDEQFIYKDKYDYNKRITIKEFNKLSCSNNECKFVHKLIE